jgi:pimeloyl-ACP methyl ester carboxylesterase
MEHHSLVVAGTRIHVAEEGAGPLVLLVHGFPESWYSWRHQIPAIAAAGYRAAAIDVRGYGRSSKPAAVDAYRMMELVGDVVGLVDALGEERATLIGHDWGAPIVWHSAMLHPERFRGVAGLSVPYTPFGQTRPLELFRRLGGERGEFYIEYFQEPGRAEAEIERDVRRWLLGFYYSASGGPELGSVNIGIVPVGHELRDQMVVPDEIPDWLGADGFEFYVSEFERTGFTGGLNRYRNVDRDWRDFAAHRGRPITIPSLFVGGSKDGPTIWGAPAIESFDRTLPALTRSVILEGCGHWVQQERPEETNRLLVEFLDRVHGARAQGR